MLGTGVDCVAESLNITGWSAAAVPAKTRKLVRTSPINSLRMVFLLSRSGLGPTTEKSKRRMSHSFRWRLSSDCVPLYRRPALARQATFT
jgi:hypothetical protein